MRPTILKTLGYLMLFLLISCKQTTAKKVENAAITKPGNPVFNGWYADPEGIIFNDQYWIYSTYSGEQEVTEITQQLSKEQLKNQSKSINPQYKLQTFLDAFSSDDLVNWKKHKAVLHIKDISWASFALWAPSIIEANGRYYLFFSANDIQSNDQNGGIGVAVADQPQGPFQDLIGAPLINSFQNDAQPIDPFVYRDDDGQHYLYYGGWSKCNVVKLSDDFKQIKPFEEGAMYKDITPENYVEGPFMLKRNGKYYFMWSEGSWQGDNYSVAYAMSDSPLGPFKRIGKILRQDREVAKGAGHHSVISLPGSDEHFIVYHRRPLDSNNGNHREVCIDQLKFNDEGYIEPVQMTFKGPDKRPLYH